MNDPRKNIEETEDILEVVKHLLPTDNVEDALELLNYAEWGAALSLICTQIYEYEVPISQSFYDEVERLGKRMELVSADWEILRELIR